MEINDAYRELRNIGFQWIMNELPPMNKLCIVRFFDDRDSRIDDTHIIGTFTLRYDMRIVFYYDGFVKLLGKDDILIRESMMWKEV